MDTKQTINKDVIAGLLIRLNTEYGAAYIPQIIREIDKNVQWAWENWPNNLISQYYTKEKPKYPTERFIYDWIENSDLEADGYDIEELNQL